MNLIKSKINKAISNENLMEEEEILIYKQKRLKEFFNDILRYLPYFLLFFLFMEKFYIGDFLFCYLIIFAILINNIIRVIKQESAISFVIITLYIIPADESKFYTILLFYLSAIFQVIRMSGTRLYTKLRKIRIWSGPIYGCLLFWRMINNYGVVQVDSFALVLFLIGVRFRPSFLEDNYDENRRTHKYLMISNFCIILIEDFVRLGIYL